MSRIEKLKDRLRPKEHFFQFRGTIPFENYHTTTLRGKDGNALIRESILNNKPLMVCRLGATELNAINNFISNKINRISSWNNNSIQDLHTLSGVFPPSEDTADKFSTLYLKELQKVDILGVWNNFGEDFISQFICNNNVKLVELTALEPYFYLNNKPWTETLKNKNVLVVHPFAKSILYQYSKHRKDIFSSQSVLPDFNLKVIPAIQSLGETPNNLSNWFEALNYMKEQIRNVEFDVCIIGAGAYGLPLASFVKEMGKQAIHMGGATQLLFGIKGQRWLNHEVISKLFNKHWTFPRQDEKPTNYISVEDGCYW